MSTKEELFKSKISVLESEKSNALREVHDQSQLVQKKSAELAKAEKNINELKTKIQNMENDKGRMSIMEFIQENNAVNTVKKSPKNKPLGREDKKTSNEDQVKLKSLIKTFEQTEKNNLVKSGEKPKNVELEALKKQCDKLTRDKSSLKKQLEDSKHELRRLSDTVENLENTQVKLEDEIRSLKLNDVTEENEKLKADFHKLFKFSQSMSKEYKRAKVELNKIPIYKLEVDAKNNKIIELEVQLNERNHNYNLLAKLNQQLEKNQKSLMEHSNKLVKQLDDAYKQSREDQELHYSANQKKAEEYNNLLRSKEKLEEKFIEQFKGMESTSGSAKKKNGSRNSIISKAARLLQSKSRRSFAEDSPATELSYDFKYFKNSDVSLGRSCVSDFGLNLVANNVPRNRKSRDMFEDFDASEFSFDGEPGIRKSLDFEEDEDPDKTLHEDSGEEKKKSSLEEAKDMCGEPIYQNKLVVAVRPGSRSSSVYTDQGCA